MSLLVVGGTVVDLIFAGVPRLPTWPRHTESTPANLVLLRHVPIVTLGGNGANAAFVAARCGAAVTLHTQIGDDALGQLARSWLESAGCRVCTADRIVSTAVNVTAANTRQERAMFFHPGTPFGLPSLVSGGAAPSHLLVGGWPHPPLAALARYLRGARERGIFTALDAGPILGRPWTLRTLRPVLASLDLFLINEYELCQVTRTTRWDAGLERVRAVFSGNIVVKRGEDGALWLPAGGDSPETVTSRRVRTVNTVGAGDSFNGALLAGLARGRHFAAALQAACLTAASVVRSPRGVLGVRPANDAAPLIPFHSKTETTHHENLARQR